MPRCRDENGRFCKKDDEKTEVTIRIPYSKYMPFLCLLIAFLIASSPWLFVFPKLFKKLMREVGVTLIQSSMYANETINITNCEGIGGTCPEKKENNK